MFFWTFARAADEKGLLIVLSPSNRWTGSGPGSFLDCFGFHSISFDFRSVFVRWAPAIRYESITSADDVPTQLSRLGQVGSQVNLTRENIDKASPPPTSHWSCSKLKRGRWKFRSRLGDWFATIIQHRTCAPRFLFSHIQKFQLCSTWVKWVEPGFSGCDSTSMDLTWLNRILMGSISISGQPGISLEKFTNELKMFAFQGVGKKPARYRCTPLVLKY